jgi:excisionase family DNA binding protein
VTESAHALEHSLGLEEAARLLRLAPSTLRKRAAAGSVPGYKPGRQWVFLPEEIAQYVKASRPQCRSIAAATLRAGGVVSKSTIEKSASQLAQQIASKRRNLKPQLALVHGGKRD